MPSRPVPSAHRTPPASMKPEPARPARSAAAIAGYEISADGAIPGHAITAYNETHLDRPC